MEMVPAEETLRMGESLGAIQREEFFFYREAEKEQEKEMVREEKEARVCSERIDLPRYVKHSSSKKEKKSERKKERKKEKREKEREKERERAFFSALSLSLDFPFLFSSNIFLTYHPGRAVAQARRVVREGWLRRQQEPGECAAVRALELLRGALGRLMEIVLRGGGGIGLRKGERE